MRFGFSTSGCREVPGVGLNLRCRRRVACLLDGEPLEDFAPTQEKSGDGIGENHFAGAEALALGDLGFFQIDEAGFRSGDQ